MPSEKSGVQFWGRLCDPKLRGAKRYPQSGNALNPAVSASFCGTSFGSKKINKYFKIKVIIKKI